MIDIGAWDGYFSFDAERRGAARVLATDSFAWQKRSRAGFDFARQQLESQVGPGRSMSSISRRMQSGCGMSRSSWACCITCGIRCWRSRRSPA